MEKKFAFLLFLIFVLSAGSTAQTGYWHYQNSNTRALSMAGTFTAVQDYHNSLVWNPAALVLAKDRTRMRNREYFKTNFDLGSLGLAFVGLVVQGIQNGCEEENNGEDETSDEKDKVSFWEVMGLFLYSFRGVTFIDRDNSLISLNLHEDIMDYETDITHILDNSYQTLVFSHLIGREFSLGASVSYYQVHHAGTRRKGMGGTVGLQYNSVKYAGLTYGLTFFTFSNPVADVRSKLERIYNNSLHFGLAYQLHNRFLFALDLKNITAFKKKYFGEVHIGFEQNIIGNVFLREGLFFWENSISKTVSGFGIGYKTNLFKSVKEDNLDISLGGLFSCPVRQGNNIISYRSDASVTLRYSF